MDGEVPRFYDGAVVFVTGGTGFLGKLLIEKLLRYTLVEKIFLLVRCKKEKNEAQRYREVFEQKIFDCVKEKQPDFMNRIELITGDCVLPDLGIGSGDWAKLLATVNVVFHCAATVRFDQKLKTAAYINIRATRDLIKHAKQMKNLKAFVHVSTAYANCTKTEILEVFYEPGLDPDKLFTIFDALSDEQVEACTSSLLGSWPNTYAFTKCISEEVVRSETAGLPSALVRPSIVISTYKEPIPGWIDNFYGPVGVAYGVGLGLLRSLHGIPDSLADIVPAEYVINTMIVAAWKASLKKPEELKDVDIYNYVSSEEAPITWNTYMEKCYETGGKVPSPKVLWKPIFDITPHLWLHNLKIVFLHWVPAYVFDFIRKCLGKKPMLVDGYHKIHKFIGVIAYFTNNQWKFSNRNTVELWKQLGEPDRKLFPFSMEKFNWDDYFSTYIVGARVHLLNDPIDTIPAGRRKLFILTCAHYAIVTLVLGAICWFFCKCFSIILGT